MKLAWAPAIALAVALAISTAGPQGALAENAATATCDQAGIVWVRRLISSGPMTLGGMVQTADGGLVVAGKHRGDLRLETPGAPGRANPLAAADGSFLMRLASDGSVRWLREISGAQEVGAVAVRPDGTIAFGGVEGVRVLVGVYADDGTPGTLWTVGTVSGGKERFGSVTLTELAVDGERIVLAGTFFGLLELGAGAHRRTLAPAGSSEIYVAALGNDGALGWALRGGGSGGDTPGPLALGRDGSVAISGVTSDSGRRPAPGTVDPVTLGKAPASAPVLRRTGGLDGLVGRVDRQGRPVWAATVGGDEPWGLKPPDKEGAVKPLFDESIAGALALPNGETLFVGNAARPTLFGGKTMLAAAADTSAGGFLARVSATGQVLAAASLGPQHIAAVAAAPDGDLVVAGELEGVANYPATGTARTTMTSAGREDVFVARQAPNGALRWVTRLGGRGHDRAERVAVDARGALTLAARFGEGFAVDGHACGVPPPPEFPASGVDLVRFAPGGPAPDDARERRLAAERAALSALRDEAARAFENKRYADACAAYQKIAASRPDSAAALADVGLCLQRLGKKKEAIAANRGAVVLGDKTDLSDEGEPAARKHAYFNLSKLGVRVAAPKTGCDKLPSEPGCRRGLWACVGKSHSEGSGGSIDSTYVRVGISRAAAQIEEGEYAQLGVESSVPDQQRDHADVEVERTIDSICREGRDGPGCGDDDGTTTCELVSANACLGLIGFVCEVPAPGNDRAGTEVEELRITAP